MESILFPSSIDILFASLLYIIGGQAKTIMFVQLNPDIESYSETISTLKFAERVSGVELGAARSNREGRGVRELMEQVQISFGHLPCKCRNIIT